MLVNALSSPTLQGTTLSGTTSPLNVSDALALFRSNPTGFKSVAVTDTRENIASNFEALAQMGSKLSGLNITGSTTASPLQLSLTSAQYRAGATTLGKIKSPHTLMVTNVTMDQLNAVLSNKKVKNVEVADSSANISARFSNLLNQPNRIDKITQTGTPSTLSLTGAQFNDVTLGILAKIEGRNANNVMTAGEYSVSLRDVSMAKVAAATGNAKVSSVAVRDSSANISANLAALDNSKISSIMQTDAAGTIRVTDTQYQDTAISATLGKLIGASSLAVTDVSAARAATVAAGANVRSVSVKDTAANIIGLDLSTVPKIVSTTINDSAANISANYTGIAALSGLTRINLSDSENITLTATQLGSAKGLLAKIAGSYGLNVTGVSAGNVASTARLNTVRQIQVSDSVSSALANLSALKSSSKVTEVALTGTVSASALDKLDELGGKLTEVTGHSGDIAINYDQYVRRSVTMAKIDGASFTVSGVGASVAKVLSGDASVTSLSVRDSGANIASNIADLVDVVAKIGTVNQSDRADITLTKAQYDAAYATDGVLSKLKDASGVSTYALRLTSALAAEVATTLAANDKIKQMSVSDSSANISTSLGDLGSAAAAGKMGSITQTDPLVNIALTQTQLSNTGIAAALGRIATNYKLDVSGVTAASATSLLTNSRIAKLSVEDSAASISTHFASLASIHSTIKALTVTDPASTINISASKLFSSSADFTSTASLLGKIDSGYTLNAQNASVTQALVLRNNDKVSKMTIQDAGTFISARFTDLNALKDAGKLTAITLTDPSNTIVLTDTQYADKGAAILADGFITNGNFKLSISGVSAADAADDTKNVNLDARVVSYSVKDSGANFVLNLAALEGRGSMLQSIQLTDNDTDPLALTGSQYVDYIGTLSKINGGTYDAAVTDLSAEAAATADNDSNVSTFTVKDTAANLVTHLAALDTAAAAKLTAITQDETDTDDLDLTYTQWSGNTAALGLMDSPITWTVSGVAAAEVATVLADTQVNSLAVSDTAANIVAKLGDSTAGGDLDDNVAKITSITVTGTDALALSGAQYVDNLSGVLAKISGGYSANITGLTAENVDAATADTSVLSFTVEDDAANLGSYFDKLVSAGDKLTGITQSDSDPVDVSLAALVADPSAYAATLDKFDTAPSIQLI